ncbi:hypothetical protein CsSME_00000863 [Camellia sinensis var. sinensis]
MSSSSSINHLSQSFIYGHFVSSYGEEVLVYETVEQAF